MISDPSLPLGYRFRITFNGGNHSGKEFHTWEGMAIGYEGTMYSSFGSLYAIAVEQGVIKPFDPEWWPAGAKD